MTSGEGQVNPELSGWSGEWTNGERAASCDEPRVTRDRTWCSDVPWSRPTPSVARHASEVITFLSLTN